MRETIDFNSVFKEYNAYVFKIIINEAGKKLSKQDIEETVSDVFFQMWKNQHKIKDHKKIKSYLGKIAKNSAKNKMRSIKDQLAFDENGAGSYSNDKSQHVKEQLRLVSRALEQMDPIDRKIFMMFYYDNKKIKEIGKEEEMKIATVKTRLHRTRKRLKKILEKRGYRNEY